MCTEGFSDLKCLSLTAAGCSFQRASAVCDVLIISFCLCKDILRYEIILAFIFQ